MPIHLPAPPVNGQALVMRALECAVPNAAGSMPYVTGPALLLNPYRGYYASLSSVAAGEGLGTARAYGWRYVIAQGGVLVTAVELVDQGPPVGLSWYATFHPPLDSELLALNQAEDVGGVPNHDYELRYLRIPGLDLAALWLKDQSRDDDRLIPIEPVPDYLVANKTYTAEEFSDLIRGPAHRAVVPPPP